jgi:hypothetical protein
MRRQFFRPAPRSIWAVVSFAPQNFPLSDVEQSVSRLRQSCQNLGEQYISIPVAESDVFTRDG